MSKLARVRFISKPRHPRLSIKWWWRRAQVQPGKQLVLVQTWSSSTASWSGGATFQWFKKYLWCLGNWILMQYVSQNPGGFSDKAAVSLSRLESKFYNNCNKWRSFEVFCCQSWWKISQCRELAVTPRKRGICCKTSEAEKSCGCLSFCWWWPR